MSDDLIKRSDAIKALYKYSFVSKDVIEREIKAIPTADRPQGWIPVSERLPKTGVANQCLVTVEFPRAHSCGVYCGSRVVDNDWECIDWECIDIEGTWTTLPGISKVLAWMPLPKPWKGADDEVTTV